MKEGRGASGKEFLTDEQIRGAAGEGCSAIYKSYCQSESGGDV